MSFNIPRLLAALGQAPSCAPNNGKRLRPANRIQTDPLGFIFESATPAPANPDNAPQGRACALIHAAARDSVLASPLEPDHRRAALCRGPESPRRSSRAIWLRTDCAG